MDTIDIVNTTLVIISIGISGIAIYLPLRKISKLTSRLVAFHYDQKAQMIIATYMIGNTGNVEWYLMDASILVYSESAQKMTRISVTAVDVPRIIESNRVNLVTISCNEIKFTTAEDGSELAHLVGIEQDFQLFAQFKFLNPDGTAIVYAANIKGLVKDEHKNGPYWDTVDLNKIEWNSSDYHSATKS